MIIPKISIIGNFIKKPPGQICISFILTVIFTIIAAGLENFNGAGLFILLAYHAPIVFAFFLFLFTESQNLNNEHWIRQGISAIVILMSSLRAVMEVPFYSGHAFFITYMVLITRSRVTRVVAVLVFLDVVWVKIFLLHDPTLWGGIILGITVWLAYWMISCQQ